MCTNSSSLDMFTKNLNTDEPTSITNLGDLVGRFFQGSDDPKRKIRRGEDQKITHATLPELVNVLTDEREYYGRNMLELTDSFFLFFRLFAPPRSLLDMLIKRFNECPPKGAHGLELVMWNVHHRMAKIRIAKLLLLWLKVYWKEETEGDLVGHISMFVVGTICKDTDIPTSQARELNDHAFARSTRPIAPGGRWFHREKLKTQKERDSYPPTEFEINQIRRWEKLQPFKPSDVINFSTFFEKRGYQELARVLTVTESQFFHSFQPEDLIMFDDKNLQTKLSNWRIFSLGLMLWVAKCILGETDKDVMYRAKAYALFAAVARVCFALCICGT